MKRLSGAFQIAAVYVGTVIGAGFATGREIVEFFTRFGIYGLVGIVVSGWLFIMLGTKILVISHDIKARSYEQFNEYVFGKWFSKGMNLLMMLMLIGVSAVMVAGAGAVFEEQLGQSRQFGIVLTLGLGFLTMLVGTRGLFAVNTIVVPLMIFFNLYLLYVSFTHQPDLSMMLSKGNDGLGWKTVLSPFAYVAFNLAMAQAVLVPIAGELKDRKMIKYGGYLGGILLTIILISSHLTLSLIPDVTHYEIPMAVMMKTFASGMYLLYIIIIYGEIFTSVIGGIFGLEKQLSGYLSIPRILIFTMIIVVIYSLSFFEYSRLLSYLYPLFGYMSILFMLLVAWKKGHKAVP
ncbi:putative membrane protein YkvI [Rossellomorea marisflavi]